jgi:hypothetical protein
MKTLVVLLVTLCAASTPLRAQVVDANSKFPPVLTTDEHKLRLTIEGTTRTIQYGLTGEDDALVQGDIILGKGFDIEAYRLGQSAQGLPNFFGLFRIGDSFLWSEGRVRYMYSAQFKKHDIVELAIAHWQQKTRIRFERIAEPSGNYVLFEHSALGCMANTGMQQNGQQYVKLGDICGFGDAVHEIGHAVGLGHEHMRSDRDRYVTYLAHNVEPNMRFNFNIDELTHNDVKTYCYRSIMHYSETEFGVKVNGQRQRTLVPKQPVIIGQRVGLDSCDIEVVEQMYAREFAKRDRR